MNNRHEAYLQVGKQLFIGHNNSRSYVNGTVVPCIHAEVDAILKSPLVKAKSYLLQGQS